MKKIECILRPGKLEEVKDALSRYGINGMTVYQVMGCGLQGGRKEIYRGTELTINLLPKIKMEVVVADKDAEEIVNIIRIAALTGEIGDGKVFISPVENAVRIRTGETGNDAL